MPLEANISQRRQRLFAQPSVASARVLGAVAPDDPPLREVIWRELDPDAIAGYDTDEVEPHLPREMREHRLPTIQRDPEHRVWQRFGHDSLNLNGITLSHTNLSLSHRRPGSAHGAPLGLERWSR